MNARRETEGHRAGTHDLERGEAGSMKKLCCAVIVLSVGGGCGGDSNEPGNPVTAPVTISYLRHDNPPYVKADDEFFAGYKTDHSNVTVADSTIKYQALGATLLAQLKTNTLTADLVRVIPSWVCSFADNLEDVPADVLSVAEAPNTYFAAPLAGSTCNGKLKGLPIEYNLEYGGV